MKQRILSNWTFTRAMFLVMGILVIIQSAMISQWLGVVFGMYFASMGLFAFGCASGNCATEPLQKTNATIEDVEFEEVKTQ